MASFSNASACLVIGNALTRVLDAIRTVCLYHQPNAQADAVGPDFQRCVPVDLQEIEDLGAR